MSRLSLVPCELLEELVLRVNSRQLEAVLCLPEFRRFNHHHSIWKRLYQRDLSVHPPAENVYDLYWHGITILADQDIKDTTAVECERFTYRLIMYGYDVPFSRLDATQKKRSTHLSIYIVSLGRLEMLKEISPYLGPIHNNPDVIGNTIGHGHLDMLKYFTSQVPQYTYTMRLFIRAVVSGQVHVLDYLLSVGYPQDMLGTKEQPSLEFYDRLIKSAVEYRTEDVLKYILNRAPVGVNVDEHMAQAAMMGYTELLEHFHERGA